MDMSSSKLWELVMDREAWSAAVHGVAESRTQLSNWVELNQILILPPGIKSGHVYWKHQTLTIGPLGIPQKAYVCRAKNNLSINQAVH